MKELNPLPTDEQVKYNSLLVFRGICGLWRAVKQFLEIEESEFKNEKK